MRTIIYQLSRPEHESVPKNTAFQNLKRSSPQDAWLLKKNVFVSLPPAFFPVVLPPERRKI